MKLDQIRAAIEAKTSAIDAASDAPRTVDEAVGDVVAYFDRTAADNTFLSGTLASDGGAYPFALGANPDSVVGADARADARPGQPGH